MIKKLLLFAVILSGFYCSAQTPPFTCRVSPTTPDDYWQYYYDYPAWNTIGMFSPVCSSLDLQIVGWDPSHGELQIMPSFNTKFSAKTTTDLTEGANLYYTNARARNSISVTNTGNGNATYNSSTGVFNIPNNATKLPVPYTGTTNASGLYTVTYAVAYATKPNVQAIFETTDPRDVVMLTASSTTGFTLQVQRRVDVIGLLPTYTNRTGAIINALVTPY